MLSQDEILGGVFGGLLAGFVVLIPLEVGAPGFLESQAMLYGLDATAPTWGIHLAHSLALGLIYSAIMAIGTDWYLTRLLKLTRQSPAVAKAITPVMNRIGIALVVTSLTGVQFGLVVWVVGATVAVPLGAGDAVPQLNMVVFVCLLAYGVMLGAVYGRQIAR